MDNIKRMKRMILLSLLRLLAIVITVRFATRAQDCAVRKRPPDPDKIPVMHGAVSTDGLSVTMTVTDVPADGIMQRDTEFCEAAAVGGKRKTEPRKGFDIVKLTRTGSATPAATAAVAEYKLESLPRQQWSALADRWPEATR